MLVLRRSYVESYDLWDLAVRQFPRRVASSHEPAWSQGAASSHGTPPPPAALRFGTPPPGSPPFSLEMAEPGEMWV